MRFKVMILEDHPDGVGMGCWGKFQLADEIIPRIKWEQVIKACEAEMTGLLTDMIRTMYDDPERVI